MWKSHINPIKYYKDNLFKRKYILFRKDLRYYNDYKNGYWKNEQGLIAFFLV